MIRNPNDILKYLDENIEYGWVGDNGIKRVNNMDNFRLHYRILSNKNAIKYGVGTCIEQVSIMKELLDNLGIESKMYSTRIYEDESFNDLNKKERMHCFILYFIDGRTYQLEHPNPDERGIHEYKNEEDAIRYLEDYYENMTKEEYIEKGIKFNEEDIKRKTTEFYEAKEGLTFKEFNLYLNSLDKKKIK